MDVLILTVFVSLVLVLSAVLFFGWNVRNRSHEHADRLMLLPLQEESTSAPAQPVNESNPAQGRGPDGSAGGAGRARALSGYLKE